MAATTVEGFELDHLFVAVPNGAPQMDELVAAGFREGTPNDHPGQGTACRRLFFAGPYLELLWLEDGTAASSPEAVLAGIGARAGMRPGASRLGIGLRRGEAESGPLPIDTWEYRPPYLPEGMAIAVSTGCVRVEEPLIFFVPGGIRGQRAERVPAHTNGACAVTGMRCTLALDGEPSPELARLLDSGCLELERGARELLAIELDHGAQGRELDLLPGAPLRLTW